MSSDVKSLVVVGGGAGGLACAAAAARLGVPVEVLEKTDRPGHKLALTGGRKGNFTHAASPREMEERFDCDRTILRLLLRRFPYQRVVELFHSLGIDARTDADGCVWPKRANAADLRDALLRTIAGYGGTVRTACRVAHVSPGWNVKLAGGEAVAARNICLATGGASYPQTGSTGDGLRLAAELGLETTPWFAALASLRTKPGLRDLAGITQPLVEMELVAGGSVVRSGRGHFIFAHDHVSGSSVLNLCGYAARALQEGKTVKLGIDWVPGQRADEVLQEFDSARNTRPRTQLATVAARYVSRRLATTLCAAAGVPPERLMAVLKREEAQRFVAELKRTEWQITGTEPIERAIATGGGVKLGEVDFTTMQARRLPGLYVVGELLDTWAETGGYNLHLAWASGIAAAEAVAGRQLDRF